MHRIRGGNRHGDAARAAHSTASARRGGWRVAPCPAPCSTSSTAGPRTRSPCAATRRRSPRSSCCPARSHGSTARDQRLTLFGREIAMPLIVGPTGLSGLLWPDGELATARAAAAAGIRLLPEPRLDLHDRGAGRRWLTAPRWMQVFMFRDRGLTRSFTERAQAAGYDALVLTTDNQVAGQPRARPPQRLLRSRPGSPPRPMLGHGGAARLAVAHARPARPDLRQLCRTPAATCARIAGRMASLLDPGASWADVAWLRGALARAAAAQGRAAPRRGAACGRRGDRRHRRQQPWRPPARRRPGHHRALPAIVAAVAGRIPVLVDGGVRRGADIARALALGATACLIGRPASVGSRGRRRGRGRRRAGASTAASSTGSWPCAAGMRCLRSPKPRRVRPNVSRARPRPGRWWIVMATDAHIAE